MKNKVVDGLRNQFQGLRESLSFEIKGAVLFGSWARGQGKMGSDIDILIIGEPLPSRMRDRIIQMIDIQDNITLYPLEIVLLTPEECRDNFNKHNPLFLDISTEGLILIDTDGLLENLIEETKRYIREEGIKKTERGWLFPIKYREVSYLSKLSNLDFIEIWLEDSQREIDASKGLKEMHLFDKSVYHAQQAVEKALKAIMLCFGWYEKTHYVAKDLEGIIDKQNLPHLWSKRLKGIAKRAKKIKPEVGLARYPGIKGGSLWVPYVEYVEKDSVEALITAEE
ncbi:MAG TPA: HEPN domain-containing protein, partial [Syntrophaceae bacterium]|nr:HEPN domain-containing protein [Syntrophaceae bacterium]